MSKAPRGIRNNNPGNIEWNSPWQGLLPVGRRTDSRFAQFASPTFGIRALACVIITYQDKRRAKDGSAIDSVREIIERWAPHIENDTNAYVKHVAAAVGIGPDDETVDVHDYRTVKAIVEAIIRHENGPGPLKTANTWYADEVIDEGLRLAGIVNPVPVVAKMPVTKETVAATGTGAIGVAQIAEVAPAILDAVQRSDSHLSSGSVVRIVVGVLTIALAAVIAWSQVKKHQAGVVA